MTRHTWRPGDAIDPGATYYPMDGARQCDPLEPDDVIAALDAWAKQAESAGHWIGPFKWNGGDDAKCPLPDDAHVKFDNFGFDWRVAGMWNWKLPGGAFRYHTDNPAGWLPRGDWIPPAELWDEGCPVQVEWRSGEDGLVGRVNGSNWTGITHIRLVAREPQAGLPEGWSIRGGALVLPHEVTAFIAEDIQSYTPAAIR